MTISDSKQSLLNAWNATLEHFGFSARPEKEVLQFMGLSLEQVIHSIFPELPAPFEDVVQVHRDNYKFHMAEENLLPNVSQIVRTLRQLGVTITVHTNKSRNGLDNSMGKLGLDIFHHTITRSEVPESECKPNPGFLNRLSSLTSIPPERSLCVGDSIYDMQSAVRANWVPCGITTGISDRNELIRHGAEFVIDDMQELLPIIF